MTERAAKHDTTATAIPQNRVFHREKRRHRPRECRRGVAVLEPWNRDKQGGTISLARVSTKPRETVDGGSSVMKWHILAYTGICENRRRGGVALERETP